MQQSEPYVISKKRTVRYVYKGRIIAFIIAVCALIIAGAVWFSRTAGKLITDSHEFGFVCMGRYTALDAASSRADEVIKSGGAGYLYGTEEYLVMASCYNNITDADSVTNRLISGGESATVYALKSPAIKINKPKENASAVKKLLVRPYELFDELYGISVKCDTGEITESAAKYAALKMSVTCAGYAEQCDALLSNDTGVYLKSLYSAMSQILDNLSSASENVSQRIKYALCETAEIICRLTNEFANKSKNL